MHTAVKLGVLAVTLMLAILIVITVMHVIDFEGCMNNYSLYDCKQMEDD